MISLLQLLMTLTPADYAHLAKVVKVEAALNTMDEHCVAVSVLNRVRSPKFPGNVSGVVYSPGQYEGMWRNQPTVDWGWFRGCKTGLRCSLHTASLETGQILKDRVC